MAQTVQLQTMALDIEARALAGLRPNGAGQIRDKINELAATRADEVIVAVDDGIEAAGLVAEFEFGDHAVAREPVQRVVDGGASHARVLAADTTKYFRRSGVVMARTQDVEDGGAMRSQAT